MRTSLGMGLTLLDLGASVGGQLAKAFWLLAAIGAIPALAVAALLVRRAWRKRRDR